MDPQVFTLFLAWLQLNTRQREQFHMIVGTVHDGSEDERERIQRQIDDFLGSIEIGPLTTPCPRCGR